MLLLAAAAARLAAFGPGASGAARLAAAAGLTRLGAAALSAAAFASGSRRGMAVDVKHRDEHEMHRYLDDLFCLKGKTALVTGASGGVGAAACLALAKCGADIVAADVRKAGCADVLAAVKAMGRHAEFVEVDVRDRGSVDDAFQQVDKRFGHLHLLIANAGILGQMQLPQDTSEDNWRDVFATNVDGVFHCARAAYPLLKASGPGAKVVITSSIAALYGYGQQAAYCASKGALLPLAKSLAIAWAPHINVNVVLPGAINTPFTKTILDTPEKLAYMKQRIPLGRLGEPEDIVGAMVFLCSHGADYITGTHILCDGGGTARAMAQ